MIARIQNLIQKMMKEAAVDQNAVTYISEIQEENDLGLIDDYDVEDGDDDETVEGSGSTPLVAPKDKTSTQSVGCSSNSATNQSRQVSSQGCSRVFIIKGTLIQLFQHLEI